MPSLTHDQAVALQAKRQRHGARNPRKSIIAIQRLLMKDIENVKTSADVRAKCALAYEKLEDRLRILNNKPLPTKGTTPKAKVPRGPAPLSLPMPIVESEAKIPSDDRSEATG